MTQTNPMALLNMTDAALIEFLGNYAIARVTSDTIAIEDKMVMDEVKKRLENLAGYKEELRKLRAPENIRQPESVRSLELVVNDLVSMQHPDPISMLFDQIKLMAQTTRMLDAESFSKVTGKLQAMRAFSDVIDFRHALMNLCVVLKISDQGDVEVSYRSRQMQPMMMNAPIYPGGSNVFGMPPYHNMAGGRSNEFNESATRPAESAAAIVNLPLSSFIEKVIVGNMERVQLTEGFRDGDQCKVWESQVVDITPVDALRELIQIYTEPALVWILGESSKNKLDVTFQVFPNREPAGPSTVNIKMTTKSTY